MQSSIQNYILCLVKKSTSTKIFLIGVLFNNENKKQNFKKNLNSIH